MGKITIKDFFLIFYRSRFLFSIVFLFSFALGIFLYKITPNVYTSSIRFLPIGIEDKSKQSGLSSLASLAGVDLMSSNAGVPVAAYSTILQSPLFLMNLIGEEVVFRGDTILLHNYLDQRIPNSFKEKLKHYGNPLNNNIVRDDSIDLPNINTEELSNLKKLPILNLASKVRRSINILKGSIEFKEDIPKELLISVKLGDPEISAQVAKLVVVSLEEFLKNFSKDSRSDRSLFLKKELEKAKDAMITSQEALAAALDGNINVNKARAKMNIERLELNHSIAQRNYLSILSDYNNANLGLEREQGVFIVLESPSVSNIKNASSPKLVVYISLSIIFSLFFSTLTVLLKHFIKKHF